MFSLEPDVRSDMNVAMHQPNYIPWCGYFSKMYACDLFIIADDLQMSGGKSFVYRNRIRTWHGVIWLSIPTNRSINDRILDIKFADNKWSKQHLNLLKHSYKRTRYFDEVFSMLEPIYNNSGEFLVDYNIILIKTIATYLGINCEIAMTSKIKSSYTKDDRIIDLCKKTGCDTYISGKGGQNYQDPEKFKAAGIKLDVRIYEPIPYPQIHGDFIPGLSIIDALFNLGKKTIDILDYLKC